MIQFIQTQFNINLFFKARSFTRVVGYEYIWLKDLKKIKTIIIDNEFSLSKFYLSYHNSF